VCTVTLNSRWGTYFVVKKKVYFTPFVEVDRVDKCCWYGSEIVVVFCVRCAAHCARSREFEGTIHDYVIWNFNLHNASGRTLALEVDSVPKRNGYEEYFLMGKGGQCVGLTALLPSWADCHDIWEPQSPGTLRAFPGLYGIALPFNLCVAEVII